MTPERREHWRALCKAEALEPGSTWAAILELLDQVEDLEANRAWCADILEKELNCQRASLQTVAQTLKARPRSSASVKAAPASAASTG